MITLQIFEIGSYAHPLSRIAPESFMSYIVKQVRESTKVKGLMGRRDAR